LLLLPFSFGNSFYNLFRIFSIENSIDQKWPVKKKELIKKEEEAKRIII